MDVMVDLETRGTRSNSVILSIGAVEFNLKTGELGRAFYVNVDPESCEAIGLVSDQSTIDWWAKQSDAAKAIFNKTPQYDIKACLAAFDKWYPKGAQFWGNGATFDNVILANAYKAAGMKQPWLYAADRCYRTLKAIFQHVVTDEFEGIPHYALDDAVHQAKQALRICKAAGIR
jgi:exodeoxyribonuclease VIII